MRAALGLGSNVGDRLEFLRKAIGDLETHASIESVSSLYRSDPVGGPEQPDFLNAAVVVSFDGTLPELLAVCQAIELDAGRERTVRWAARTLDIDILTAARSPIDTDDLTVPHQRLAERRFALEPLAEIWPDAATGHGTARAGLERVADQSVDRLAGVGWEDGLSKGSSWVAAQVVVFAVAIVLSLASADTLGVSTTWVGRAVVVLGAVVMVGGLRALGRNLTAFPEPVAHSQLITNGIYRFARHPIYGANTLLLGGIALHESSLWGVSAAVAAGVFFWLKAEFEERRLMIAHADYRQWRSTVRWRLIPFVV